MHRPPALPIPSSAIIHCTNWEDWLNNTNTMERQRRCGWARREVDQWFSRQAVKTPSFTSMETLEVTDHVSTQIQTYRSSYISPFPVEALDEPPAIASRTLQPKSHPSLEAEAMSDKVQSQSFLPRRLSTLSSIPSPDHTAPRVKVDSLSKVDVH
ncbi:hypothetical protein CC1G_05944 [Coprinopsis cinerea okayama7|uniref:Uncharacterized protein n=1 Tax=Coprinopsis cinerea (strain Okayama-7 / 130 / ATCC MYA-4618 / FGSC 9003) TaxID=240176 RepID=A8NAJ3_COPC7|nr:hypothetical protein CC1G_05944 [Coprinopsis cinerea okayama7\|eukprot:XP_001831845.2 hypothetical protein CC1G_05944 [Coprinopsis cinerea okayama7\